MQEDRYLKALRQYYGYDSFRGIQRDIVESIGAGCDTLGLMPTGGGKSITFQVPALCMDGVCIVVTPLIALMKDQVEHLLARGITAAYVNSSMSYQQILQTYDNAIFGGLRFLYVSPERLASEAFIAKLHYMKVSMIAVDEAHCISQWGYDFRPSYLHIAEIRQYLPDVPVLALTATATPEVVEDIMDRLLFRERNVFRMSFRRDNLVYVTRHVLDPFTEMVSILRKTQGSTIVYTRNRAMTKDITRQLNDLGISATNYHAGLDFAVKDQRQQDWQQGEVRVMVATNAFGMGIDKPDVRLVIHLAPPDSIEEYFQEAGRAGRDGQLAYAVLLYVKKVRMVMTTRIGRTFPPKDYVRKVYDHLAYFFQLAVDSGEGAQYDFDIRRFCSVFHHNPELLGSALAILQRAGYIDYDLDPDSHPRIMMVLTREEMYRMRELSQLEERILEVILRKFGAVFVDFVYFEPAYIAQKLGVATDLVHMALKRMAHLGIIKYIPRRTDPIISYPKQRIDSSRLIFDKTVYEDVRERMQKHVDAMLNYLFETSECNSVKLLRYFGEESEPCGKCEICLARKNEQVAPHVPDLRQRILDYLHQHPDGVPVSDFLHFNAAPEQIRTTLQSLIDNNQAAFHEGLIVHSA